MAQPAAVQNISPRQFAILLVTSFVALGLFQFPRQLVDIGGPDALYAYLLDVGAALLALWLDFAVNRIRPSETYGGFAGKYLGPMAWPLGVYTIAIHGFLAVVALSNFGFVMQTFFLPRTPVWAITGAALATIAYMTTADTVGLARTVEFIFVPVAVLSLAMGFLVIPHMQSAYALVPGTSLRVIPTLNAAYHSFYIFLGIEAATQLHPFVRVDQQAKAHQLGYIALGAGSLLFLMGYAAVLGNTGPGLMIHLFWPPVKVMRTISFNSFLINKMGLLVVLLWGIFVLSYVGVRVWAMSHLVMPSLHLTSVTWYRRLVVIMAVVTYIGTLFMNNATTIESLLDMVVTPLIIPFVFGSPLLIITLDKIYHWRRSRRLRAEGASPT